MQNIIKYGEEKILLIVLIASIVLFITSGVIAFVYKHIIQKLTGKIANKIYEKFKLLKNEYSKKYLTN